MKLFTIGYGGAVPQTFTDCLMKAGVQTVVGVRLTVIPQYSDRGKKEAAQIAAAANHERRAAECGNHHVRG
jgi:hypothetical protein